MTPYSRTSFEAFLARYAAMTKEEIDAERANPQSEFLRKLRELHPDPIPLLWNSREGNSIEDELAEPKLDGTKPEERVLVDRVNRNRAFALHVAQALPDNNIATDSYKSDIIKAILANVTNEDDWLASSPTDLVNAIANLLKYAHLKPLVEEAIIESMVQCTFEKRFHYVYLYYVLIIKPEQKPVHGLDEWAKNLIAEIKSDDLHGVLRAMFRSMRLDRNSPIVPQIAEAILDRLGKSPAESLVASWALRGFVGSLEFSTDIPSWRPSGESLGKILAFIRHPNSEADAIRYGINAASTESDPTMCRYYWMGLWRTCLDPLNFPEVIISERIEDDEVIESISSRLADPNTRVRASAALALTKLGHGHPDMVPSLTAMIFDKHYVNHSYLYALCLIGDHSAASVLRRFLNDPNLGSYAFLALVALKDESSLREIARDTHYGKALHLMARNALQAIRSGRSLPRVEWISGIVPRTSQVVPKPSNVNCDENDFCFDEVHSFRIGSAFVVMDKISSGRLCQTYFKALCQEVNGPKCALATVFDENADMSDFGPIAPPDDPNLQPILSDPLGSHYFEDNVYCCILIEGMRGGEHHGEPGYAYFGIFPKDLRGLRRAVSEGSFNLKDHNAIVLAKASGTPSDDVRARMKKNFKYNEIMVSLEITSNVSVLTPYVTVHSRDASYENTDNPSYADNQDDQDDQSKGSPEDPNLKRTRGRYTNTYAAQSSG